MNELSDQLYFGVESKRRKFRHQLIESIQGVGHIALPLDNWVRMVTYQYSLEPLTCAGSLQALGGRFNAGYELDANTMRPWPALYFAACRTYGTSAANRPQRSIFHRLFDP